eukprot:Em0018g827a
MIGSLNKLSNMSAKKDATRLLQVMEGETQEAVQAQVATALTSDPFLKLPVVKTPVAQLKMETYLDKLLQQVDLMMDLTPGFNPLGRPNSVLELETYATHQESTLRALLKDPELNFQNAHQYAIQSTQYSLAQMYTIQVRALEVLRLQRIKKLQRLIVEEDVYPLAGKEIKVDHLAHLSYNRTSLAKDIEEMKKLFVAKKMGEQPKWQLLKYQKLTAERDQMVYAAKKMSAKRQAEEELVQAEIKKMNLLLENDPELHNLDESMEQTTSPPCCSRSLVEALCLNQPAQDVGLISLCTALENQVEKKGSVTQPVRPWVFFITSNFTPQGVFQDEWDDALQSRFSTEASDQKHRKMTVNYVLKIAVDAESLQELNSEGFNLVLTKGNVVNSAAGIPYPLIWIAVKAFENNEVLWSGAQYELSSVMSHTAMREGQWYKYKPVGQTWIFEDPKVDDTYGAWMYEDLKYMAEYKGDMVKFTLAHYGSVIEALADINRVERVSDDDDTDSYVSDTEMVKSAYNVCPSDELEEASSSDEGDTKGYRLRNGNWCHIHISRLDTTKRNWCLHSI